MHLSKFERTQNVKLVVLKAIIILCMHYKSNRTK